MSLKLLYISCHPTLEYNELLVFHRLGFDVRSIGIYTDPRNPIDPQFNPPLFELTQDIEFIQQAKDLYSKWPNILIPIHIVEQFDIVVLVHTYEILERNFENIKNKLIIRRTIGQGGAGYEFNFSKYKNNLKTVRVSKKERGYKHYCGEDAIILGPLDTNLFNGEWKGNIEKVLTVKNRFSKYPQYSKYETWKQIIKEFNYTLIGRENINIPGAISDLPYLSLVEFYRTHRVCLCMPSIPAPITYGFAEALLMGTPVVTIGQGLGELTSQHHEMIEQGVTGFYSDNITELQHYISQLLTDYTLAKKISMECSSRAKTIFSIDSIMIQWKTFFNTIGITY